MKPTLIPSKSRTSRLCRLAFALITSSSLVFQSVAPSFAQAVTVAPGANAGTEVTQAPNGVPLINIAKPNSNGLSQNVFTDFNVGQPGLIFNNSTQLGQSALGGMVLANPNLNGGSASVILNEVTSTNPSVLGGMMEVFGPGAAVVVANPNGITCDGCGFINTPRATLTTGAPTIANGQLTGFEVTQGVVDIGPGGLNASAATYFDIVSRSVMLNGAIHGQDVGIYAGQNDFDYLNRQIAAVRPSDGSAATTVAIDSSALGGMYAGKITLASTEAGVGVNAPAALVAGLGGMYFSADGRLTLGSATSQGNIQATSQSEEVRVTGVVHAGGDIEVLSGGGIELDQSVLGAFGDIALAGHHITLSDAVIVAGIDAHGVTHDGVGSMTLVADSTISTSMGSAMVAGSALDMVAGGAIELAGTIQTDANLALSAHSLDSRANLSANTLSLTTDGQMSLGGVNLVGGDLSVVSGAGVFLDGTMRAGGSAQIAAQSVDLQQGATFTSAGSLATSAEAGITVASQALVGAGIAADGTVIGNGALSFTGTSISTHDATFLAAGDISLSATGSLALTEGLVTAGGAMTLASDTLSTSATLSSASDISATAGAITSTGTIEALGDVWLLSLGNIGQTGTVRANGAIMLDADGAIDQAGTIEAGTEIILTATDATFNRDGAWIVSGSDVTISAASLSNAGAIGARRDLGLAITGDIENTDLFSARRDMIIGLGGTLTNTGTMLAMNDMVIAGLTESRALALINENGMIEANQGNLSIAANSLINRSTGVEVIADYERTVTNRTVTGYCQWGDQCNETQTRVQTEIWTDRLVGPINSARILAGSDMILAGDEVNNIYALIAANGDFSLSGTRLTNTARDLLEVKKVTTDITEIRFDCNRVLGLCVSLRRSVIESPTEVRNSSAIIGSAYSTIQAGGALSGSFTDRIDNVTVREGAGQVGLSSGDGVAGPTAASVNLGINTGGTAPTPGIDLGALLGGSSLTQISPNPHSNYLIETRPEFVDLSNFFNSDYFFARLPDYQPDQFLRRLGDAYIETRLIQDQIFALTGRRLLEGFGSDLDQILALYENALATAAALDLPTGISLTAEQVAALTDDIIWQEWVEVDGQMVLVPRVYLAATSRNSQGGAQITGESVLLASANVSNSGVIESDGLTGLLVENGMENLGGRIGGDTLSIDVGGTLANLSGVIAGDTVAIQAGSLVNQTVVTRDEHSQGFADRAHQQATITGTGNVVIAVDQDVLVVGGEIAAGEDLAIVAGGEVAIVANQLESSAATTFSGGDASAYSLTNQLAGLTAGQDLAVSAGGNMALTGAEVMAGGSATLSASGDLTIASVQDLDHSEMDASFGSAGLFDTRIDISRNVSSSTTVGGTINAGGDVALTSEEGDITLRAANVDAAGAIDIAAEEGLVSLLSATDSEYAQETFNTENLFWWTTSDEGHYVEEVVHTLLTSGEGLTITTRDGIVVDYHETGSFDGSIDQLSQVDGLGWMAELRDRDDVNWQVVAAAQEHWHYQDQGLTEVGAALVALAVASVTGGMGTSIAGAVGMGGNAVMTAALEAGFTALAQKASIALINNQGDIGAVLAELGSQASILSLVSSMLTAGLTAGALDIAAIPGVSPDLSFSENLLYGAQTNLIKASIRVGVSTLVEGAPLDQTLLSALRMAAADTIGAAVATEIGNAYHFGEMDTVGHKIAHAALGCATGAIASGDCAGGASGAVAGEIVAEWVRDAFVATNAGTMTAAELEAELLAFKAQGVNVAALAGGMLAALVGGDVNTGAMAGGNAAEHNAFFVPFLIALAAGATYSAAVGEGDPLHGLAIIGQGNDPLSQAMEAAVVAGVELSMENFPDQTLAALGVLVAIGETADIVLTYVDSATGNVVSANWNALEPTLRDQIVGGTIVASVAIPSGAVAKLQALKTARIATNTVLPNVPGRVQSRVNLAIGDNSSGWTHVVDRHFNPDKNASQFTVSQSDLRRTLQSPEVVNTPVTRTVESAGHGTLYVREVDLGRPIGTDKFNSFQPTSTMTIMTDRFGNLVTATPGVVR